MSRKLGNYEVLDEIGRGGMAIVYKARQRSLDRIVAIKELDLKRSASDPRAGDRFELEAKAAASLHHPSIITVHDFWERGKKAYIAMEFVDGFELKEVLDATGALDPRLATQIAIQVCGALKYAHERGIIHRDVKPGNIMLSRKGDVKLADFGIVFVSGTTDLTTTGAIIGTPSYMSPEQIRDEEPGPASDVFSLGVVLYEAVTGSRPFSAQNEVALTHAILRKRPIKPRRLNKRISPRLSRVIMKCLRKKSHKRYATMDEMEAALVKTLPRRTPDVAREVARLLMVAEEPGTQESTIPLKPARVTSRTRHVLSLSGLVSLAVLLIILVIPLLPWKRDLNSVIVDSQPSLLTIAAYPWAEVILDGKSLGYTPRAAPFQVPSGRHKLVLRNPDLGTQTFDLMLKPGESASIKIDFLEKKR